MKRENDKLQTMVIAALLSAIGIIIPMFAPKFLLEPASFTLASHVPVFIAIFISPLTAISVALITTIGFLFGGYPIVIVLRALTHVVFATVASFVLKKYGTILLSTKSSLLFNFLIGILHAVCEVIVVTFFYLGSGMTSAYYEKGYILSVVVLVGIGTVIHSMIDYTIAVFVWKPLQYVITIPVNAKIAKR
ncbi:MAG: hypothetical protein GX913_04640 [Clostridiales bacterium]|nr:hypothetical protein [Clostridiales bacterium]